MKRVCQGGIHPKGFEPKRAGGKVGTLWVRSPILCVSQSTRKFSPWTEGLLCACHTTQQVGVQEGSMEQHRWLLSVRHPASGATHGAHFMLNAHSLKAVRNHVNHHHHAVHVHGLGLPPAWPHQSLRQAPCEVGTGISTPLYRGANRGPERQTTADQSHSYKAAGWDSNPGQANQTRPSQHL